MYKNYEGFSDPTAGLAMSHVMREYREERRRTWQRETEIKERSKAYIASKYAGDTEKNRIDAINYCRAAVKAGYIPVASHLLYPQILDDKNPHDRELGLLFGQALLSCCDEVWFVGTKDKDGRIEMSDGMKAEYREARRLHKKIRFFAKEEIV